MHLGMQSLSEHLRRSWWQICLLTAIVVALGYTDSGQARPATAEPDCTGGSCIYLPLVSSTSPIFIAFANQYQYSDACKGACFELAGGVAVNGTQPVYSATLTGRFFDAAGQLIATEVITPVLPVTLPGQHNPFTHRIFADTGLYPTAADVAMRSWEITSTIDYRPVTIVSAEGMNFGVEGSVRGIARNDQPRALTNIVILGELDGVGSTYSTKTIERLEPGETAEVTLQYYYPRTAGPLGATQPVVQGVGQLEP